MHLFPPQESLRNTTHSAEGTPSVRVRRGKELEHENSRGEEKFFSGKDDLEWQTHCSWFSLKKLSPLFYEDDMRMAQFTLRGIFSLMIILSESLSRSCTGMSANLSNSDAILTLNSLSWDLNRYLSILILSFGTMGNVLNCVALSQRGLRSNPCSSLFLASSIASLFTLISGVAVRLLAGWSADLTDTVGWLCKCRIFVLFSSRTMASWFIMLATVDRWLASSLDARLRQMSRLGNTQRGMIIIPCLSCLAYVQVFYCYEANLVHAPLKCYGKTTWCRLLIDSEFTAISTLLPSLLMLIFGSQTIWNLKRSALRRVQPVSNPIARRLADTVVFSRRSKKKERHLRLMLLVQVILLTLFSLPQALQNLYSNISHDETKTPLHTAINDLIFNLFILLTYVTNGMPFYIYTLTGGSVFRRALLDTLRKLMHKCTCRS